MDDLIFTQENVEKLLLEAGFSNVESRAFLSSEDPNTFRTEAFLYKNSSREIYIIIECLGNVIAIYMRNNIDFKILKNQRYIILTIENGEIDERGDFELNAFNSKSVFLKASGMLTNFISKLKKITLQ